MSAETSMIDKTKTGPVQKCPFHAGAGTVRKTADPIAAPEGLIGPDTSGVWHVRGYREARAILRAEETTQAGFKAEEMDRLNFMRNKPVLYMDGEAHHVQRRGTARFFTPRATKAYHELMARYATEVLAPLRRGQRVDLSLLSMGMAVQVASQVIGLMESIRPGMDHRLASFFEFREPTSTRERWRQRLLNQWNLGLFFLLDVRPAIKARRQSPKEDLISHLIETGYSNAEIMTECIMYGAAGMATTREFICAAAWHLLEAPEQRAWYLASDEETRYAFLHETLRLEPVVGHILRRTTADLPVPTAEGTITIPANSLIDLHIYEINADQQVVGEAPLDLCPMRPLHEPRVPAELMSFGDGHHRCAGAYVAIQETDVFLMQLLALPGLRVVQWPTVTWNPIAKGYEMRAFWLEASSNA